MRWEGSPGSPYAPAPCKPVHLPRCGARNKYQTQALPPAKHSPGLWVPRLEHSHGHQTPTQGCTPFGILLPPRETPSLLPSLQLILRTPALKAPLQLLSGVSCWDLPSTGADLVNRKLSPNQGRQRWEVARTLGSPGQGVSVDLGPG